MLQRLHSKQFTLIVAGIFLFAAMNLQSCSSDDDDDNSPDQEQNNNDNNNETNPGNPDNYSASQGKYHLGFKGDFTKDFEGEAFVEDSVFIASEHYDEAQDASAVFEFDLEGDSSDVYITVANIGQNTLEGNFETKSEMLMRDEEIVTGAHLSTGIQSTKMTMRSTNTGKVEITSVGNNHIKGVCRGVKLLGTTINGQFTTWLNGKFYAKKRD